MLNFLIYIIEISVFMSIMYFFYRYIYFKLAYFEWSRYFFYVSLMLALCIPFLPEFIVKDQYVLSEKELVGINYISGIDYTFFVKISDKNFFTDKFLDKNSLFVKFLFFVWFAGFLRYIIVFFLNLKMIRSLFLSGKRSRRGNNIIIETEKIEGAFSFFKYIFVGENVSKISKKEREYILNHEKIHSNQYHSVDNIVFELYRAFFWFNPLSKYIVANVKIVNEFITDTKVTGNAKKPEYSKLILKLASKQSLFTVNNFAEDDIFSRINILTFPENEKLRKKRFLMSTPVLIMVIIAYFFVTSLVNYYAIGKSQNENFFATPFSNESYKIISPYFENMSLKNNNDYNFSHRETTYEVKSFSDVYSINKGVISQIDTVDDWGISKINISIELDNNFEVTYKNLKECNVSENQKINRSDLIGKTGDIRFYPFVNVKLLKNKKPEDIEKYF